MNKLLVHGVSKLERSGKRQIVFPGLVLCAILTLATGCVSSGLDLAGDPGVDRSITTGSIQSDRSVETDVISDRTAIRNAVSTADISGLKPVEVPWANPATGSSGIITEINEARENGILCRQFSSSRHGFDGVGNFTGQTCLAPDGSWVLLELQPAA